MRQYDAPRLEMLAVIMALEHFKPFIEGVRVQLDTDHRRLTWIQNVKHSSGQLARWAMRLSEFNFDLSSTDLVSTIKLPMPCLEIPYLRNCPVRKPRQ